MLVTNFFLFLFFFVNLIFCQISTNKIEKDTIYYLFDKNDFHKKKSEVKSNLSVDGKVSYFIEFSNEQFIKLDNPVYKDFDNLKKNKKMLKFSISKQKMKSLDNLVNYNEIKNLKIEDLYMLFYKKVVLLIDKTKLKNNKYLVQEIRFMSSNFTPEE